MWAYNRSHSQPDETCYRLIGGDFLLQLGVPPYFRWIYHPYTLSPGDIGVSLRSSLQLGINPFFWWDYPNVVTDVVRDMHGYIDYLGLGSLDSYVRPNETYVNSIKDYLGAPISDCSGLRASSIGELAGPSANPVVAPLILDSGTFASAGSTMDTLPVDWTGQSVFYTIWTGGELAFTLTDANGTIIDPDLAAADPNVQYDASLFHQTAVSPPTSLLIPYRRMVVLAADSQCTIPDRVHGVRISRHHAGSRGIC